MKKFKDYHQHQALLLPPSLDELIDEKDLVRVVNQVVDRLDARLVESPFKGGGCPTYHPRMMLKVLLYAYSQKIYSCRRMAQAMRRDVAFMWLSGMQQPDFNTVNRFRSVYFKDILERVFADVVGFLLDQGYLRLEDYFVDGTILPADAGKYTYVWRKNTVKFKRRVQQRAEEIMQEADRINQQEDEAYAGKDLPETGAHTDLTAEQLREEAARIAERIKEEASKKECRQVQSLARQLDQQADKLARYEQQEFLLGSRNSYSKTDPDATFMRLKDDQLRAAYNIQIGTEKHFVAGFSVSQTAHDGSCFIDHMERRRKWGLPEPENAITDGGYGTEENYHYLQGRGIKGYLKYPTFYRETQGKLPRFSKERFVYLKDQDVFVCPEGRQLEYVEDRERKQVSGYRSQLKVYACPDCRWCRSRSACTPSHRRRLEVSARLERYKRSARKRLCSEKGLALRRRRGNEVESVFGVLKRNMDYTRVRLRSLSKAILDMALVFTSYNLRRLHRVMVTV